MSSKPEEPLPREWVKGNHPTLAVKGVMIAPALSTRHVGSRPSAALIMSFFLMLVIVSPLAAEASQHAVSLPGQPVSDTTARDAIAGRPDTASADSAVALSPRAAAPGAVSVRVTEGPPPDWVDLLQLLAALLVAPIAALLAARSGAIEGGKQANKAALAALREELAQEHQSKRTTFNRVVARALDRYESIGRDLVGHGSSGPIPLADLQALVALAGSYASVAPYAPLYPSQELVDQLDDFFHEQELVAGYQLRLEETLEAFRLKLDPPERGEQSNYLATERQRVEGLRETFLKAVANAVEAASNLKAKHKAATQPGS